MANYTVYVPYPNTQTWNFIPRGSGIVGVPYQHDADYLQLGICEPDGKDKHGRLFFPNFPHRLEEATKHVHTGALVPVGMMHRIGVFDGNEVKLDNGAQDVLVYWIQAQDLVTSDLKLERPND